MHLYDMAMHGYNSTYYVLANTTSATRSPLGLATRFVHTRDDERRGTSVQLDTGSSQGTVYEGAHIGSWTELGNGFAWRQQPSGLQWKWYRCLPFKMGNLTVGDYVASDFPRPTVKGSMMSSSVSTCSTRAFAQNRRGAQNRWYSPISRFSAANRACREYKLKWFVPYVLISPFIRHVDETLSIWLPRPLYVMNKESLDEHAYKSNNGQSGGSTARGTCNIGNLGTEKQDEVAFLHPRQIEMGDFSSQWCARHDNEAAVLRIGAQMLKYGSVIIDASSKQIVSNRIAEPTVREVDNKQFGVASVPGDGMAAVGLVFQKSEAYINGMRHRRYHPGKLTVNRFSRSTISWTIPSEQRTGAARLHCTTRKDPDKEVSVER